MVKPLAQPQAKAPTLKTALKMLYEAAYAIPALAGYGDHWKLTNDESDALAENTEASIGALPSAKVQAISKAIATWAPVVGLVATAVVITQARVVETRRLSAIRRSQETRTAGHEPTPSGPQSSGNGAGGGKAPGTVAGRGAELFRTGDE